MAIRLASVCALLLVGTCKPAPAPEGNTPPVAPTGDVEPAAPDPAPEPSDVDPEAPTAEDTPTPSAKADGSPCSLPDQCSGGICEGEGCGDNEGRCATPGRMCTRDLVSYCGCDGKTFRASGSCPGGRYSKREPC